jgi:hypothetical protein
MDLSVESRAMNNDAQQRAAAFGITVYIMGRLLGGKA